MDIEHANIDFTRIIIVIVIHNNSYLYCVCDARAIVLTSITAAYEHVFGVICYEAFECTNQFAYKYTDGLYLYTTLNAGIRIVFVCAVMVNFDARPRDN